MSVLTEVLKLFKYDPATDGDMTFNIGQCMNDNWDKLDAAILLAIAAAGAYNPEESYAVGDYCTYKGKLRKCSTAIPTGETWTEAHWTTTTVAAELAELSSQLSNAVRVNPGYGNMLFGNDLNDWKRLGTYNSMGGVTVNAPPGTDGWGVVPVFSGSGDNSASVLQMFIPLNLVGGKRSIYRRFFRSTWTDWEPLATATPPQEFNLPLAEGVTTVGAGYKNIYSKDQFGIVRVWFSVHFESIPASGTHVFNLPEGFRPDSICCAAAVLSMVEYYNVTVSIHPSGAAIVDHGTIGQTGPINLHGCIEFPAD